MERSDRRPTEQPTARRLATARRDGHVAASADLSAAVVLAALVTVLATLAPLGWDRLMRLFRRALAAAVAVPAFASVGRAGSGTWAPGVVDAPSVANLLDACRSATAMTGALLLVPLAVAAVAAFGVGVGQTRGLVAWDRVRPDLRRAGPGAGLRRLFGMAPWLEAGRASIKLGLVLAVAIGGLIPDIGMLPRLAGAAPLSVLATLGIRGERVALRVALALLGWGIVDWALAQRRRRRTLMMTREEADRERRDSEGDPELRAERRRLHRELNEGSAEAALRTVRFFVVERDRIAVAVAYDPMGGLAPTVVAFGDDGDARRLMTRADVSGIPVHDDVGLARALRQVAVGVEIPASLYQPIADVLRAQGETGEGNRLEAPVA